MKSYQREILICIIAFAATIFAVWSFLGRMTNEKKVIQTDLYAVIDTTPSGLLIINRPATFTRMILSLKGTQELFSQFIPEIYLSVIRQTPSLSSVIFAFHEQGIIMYTKADEKSARLIDKQIFQKTFNSYNPQIQKKNDVTFTYYPDAGNRYFGFYQYGNILVASYSKRMLEKAAERQQTGKPLSDHKFNTIIKTLDHSVPLNLIVPADSLNLYVQIDDSTEWRIQEQWITADIYRENNSICSIANLPYHTPSNDSLYNLLSDTLNMRLQNRFPTLHIQSKADIDNEVVYFITCCNPQ